MFPYDYVFITFLGPFSTFFPKGGGGGGAGFGGGGEGRGRVFKNDKNLHIIGKEEVGLRIILLKILKKCPDFS